MVSVGLKRGEVTRKLFAKFYIGKLWLIYNIINCRRKVQEAEEDSEDRYKIPEYLEYGYNSYSE